MIILVGNMNTAELLKLISETLEDNKALDVTEIDVTSLTGTIDAMVICTATSTRHAKSLANKITVAAKESGVNPFGVEGELYGEWILIDLSDVVVHIMLNEQREFYNLEKLWAITTESRKKQS